jgi:Mg-chelatase subunit ChlD
MYGNSIGMNHASNIFHANKEFVSFLIILMVDTSFSMFKNVSF